MLYSVIDIGSNAARLLFAKAFEVDGNTTVEKASLIRIPLRLGKDVFSKGKIGREKKEDFIKTMQAFKLLIDVYKPFQYKVLATAAMREAGNSQKLVEEIEKKTGLKIEVITGRQEASIIRYTNKLDFSDADRPVAFIDVGGGSTEISVECRGKVLQMRSFKIGTIRILEHHYDAGIWDEITGWLRPVKEKHDSLYCVGSGGNINKLNKLYGNQETKYLPVKALRRAYEYLGSMSVEERMSKFGFRRDRADVIVPAAEIYLKIMDYLNAGEILVPKIGLADGMVHILHDRYRGILHREF